MLVFEGLQVKVSLFFKINITLYLHITLGQSFIDSVTIPGDVLEA